MTETTLQSRIQTDLAAALKAGDTATLSTLRMLKAALQEAKTRKPKESGLSHDEEMEVLQRYVKKRRETIDELRRIGRDELMGCEQREIDVTMRYLPEPLGADELRDLIREAIRRTGASGAKDTGTVIGAVIAQVRGRADGGAVSRLVRELLS